MQKIWTFKDNENIDTEGVDLKTFKPSGKFYEDVEVLCRLFNTKVHPALKPAVYSMTEEQKQQHDSQQQLQQNAAEEQKHAEINTLNLFKHRLDRNSMKVMFLALQSSPNIHTLKFSNNGFTHSQFSQMIDYLSQETCPIQHLFFDWNPIYENDYSTQFAQRNQLYQPKQATESCLFAKLLQQNHKLQVLFLRASNLTDEDVKQICHVLKPDPANPAHANKTLKVLDISYNPITKASLKSIADMMDLNRTLEYLGLAKCSLQAKSLNKILNQIGRIPFPQDQVEAHLGKLKARDQIIEKNKKLKQSKKPEEPVPILDNIEQQTSIAADGSEVQGWVMLKNVQFKHINLCMNEVNDDIKENVALLLRRTNDDFGITLSGNPIGKDSIEFLQRTAYEVHQHRIQNQTDLTNQQHIDQYIGLKRIAF
ncbi:UNKNOWN [Stylonychia lemnae]|uniref:Uncharacterized protein n=1 Tax=Stylonychia lemnae TaxID=5949 RepID=A0A078APA1_STYLE|nr:UNKNOWN [Stylonychia lemnae]|eukprot:CDW82788.1 UNKNOWN [Stylonychia lemnae]